MKTIKQGIMKMSKLLIIGTLFSLCTITGKTFAQTNTSKTLNKEKMEISQIKITPDAYEPFHLAQGHRVGDLLFISGQTAIRDDGKLIGIGDFDAQAQKAFENLDKVLKAGGSSLKNVVKVTIMLRDMGNFNKIVKLRSKYFTAPYPADTIFEVSTLFSPDALIEIEAVAVADEVADWKK
ncbi:RidA family protein [Pedobacter frigoris]|nr:RidA family protein [Pedobacter frigoris]